MAIRTGIFGGSFNPVHKGHIALAEQILQLGLLDEIWLMVSPQNPLKENNDLWDDQFRLQLARLAVAGHPNIQVSDLHILYTKSFKENLSATFVHTDYRC